MDTTTNKRYTVLRVLAPLAGVGLGVVSAYQLNDNAAWALLLVPSALVAAHGVAALLKRWGVVVVAADSEATARHPAPTAQINPATGMFLSSTGLDGSGQAFGGRPGNRP